MLAPNLAVVRKRDHARPEKSTFHRWSHLDEMMRCEMAGIGCWIDSTRQAPSETAAEVSERVWKEGRIG